MGGDNRKEGRGEEEGGGVERGKVGQDVVRSRGKNRGKGAEEEGEPERKKRTGGGEPEEAEAAGKREEEIRRENEKQEGGEIRGGGADVRGGRKLGKEAEGKASRKPGGGGSRRGRSSRRGSRRGKGKISTLRKMRFKKRGTYYMLQFGTMIISKDGFLFIS